MNSSQLRQRFLAFFQAKDHAVVPSDSLVPANDPTLLFTGAGMNQFKDHFLGTRREMKRAASVQKCFRTGDVDQVGQTPSHLTFFEMLGNFSFGDYFKKEAIAFGWEFMTQELKISPNRLWASVYQEDREAAQIWEKVIGLPPERVVRFGATENFWPSNAPADGPNGPCGPCSEIYYDYERCFVGKSCPDPDHCAPGCPCGRFVEVWNLVFTQFDRKEDGTLSPLPMKNIDTGMGLERLCAVMQNKMSVFETDLFEPILEEIVRLLRRQAPDLVALDQRGGVYAIADHVRALTFLIGDGVVPSNDGRGYVLRMILRKAFRHGMSCGLSKPFLHTLVPVVARIMESGYPELVERRESIARVILGEEERFRQMLGEKMPLLEEEMKKLKSSSGCAEFPAAQAARFYDTHGLSYEEIAQVSKQVGVHPPKRVDFDKALQALQAQSLGSSKFAGQIFAKDAVQELVVQVASATEFVGYAQLSAPAKVVGLIQENRLAKEVKAPAQVGVLLDRSPFYAEAGGQVADVGVLEGTEGKLAVIDTQWVGNVLFHKAELREGKIRVNDSVTAAVDSRRRRQVAQNHTATHLVHAALRKVLGGHVVQAGSLVAPDRLRFDFSHPQGLSAQQRESVESLANEWVDRNFPVDVAQMPLEEARRSGAVALFGEKYGRQVRVVSIGDVSKELCGGTHLASSGEVGLLTVVEEGSVAAGVRRIEALTGRGAFSHLKKESVKLEEAAQRLKASPAEVEEAIDRLIKRVKLLEEELQRLQVKDAAEGARKLTGERAGAFTIFAQQIQEPMDHAALRSYADAIRKAEPEAVIFLSDAQGFCIAATGGSAQKRGVTASQLLKLSTDVAGGSGGGRTDLAQGRIAEPSRFPEIRNRLKEYLKERSK